MRSVPDMVAKTIGCRSSFSYTGGMTPIDNVAFERATDPILQFFTPEQARALVDYRGDAGLAAEIESLALKCNAGELTEGTGSVSGVCAGQQIHRHLAGQGPQALPA